MKKSTGKRFWGLLAVLAVLLTLGLFFSCGGEEELPGETWADWYQKHKVKIPDLKPFGNDMMTKEIPDGIGVKVKQEYSSQFGTFFSVEHTKDKKGQNSVMPNDIFPFIEPIEWASSRKNASGAKITSNAHSKDFPGIVFIWGENFKAGQQKDNGWLKVHETVFQAYVCFVLTAKVSNLYYDHLIMPYPGQIKNEEGCYLFKINKEDKNGKDHNINMVFINAFQKRYGTRGGDFIGNDPSKDPPADKMKKIVDEAKKRDKQKLKDLGLDPDKYDEKDIEDLDKEDKDDLDKYKKPTPDEDPADDEDFPTIINPPFEQKTPGGKKYIIISHPTANGAEVDPGKEGVNGGWGSWMFGGVPIRKYWTDKIIESYSTSFAKLEEIYLLDENGKTHHYPTWIWDRGDSWEHGVTGWNAVVCASRFYIEGEINEPEIPFYFACDNAAAVYVNGDLVHYTTHAFKDRDPPGATSDFKFTNFSDVAFDGEVWAHLYEVNIKPKLIEGGYNEVLVIAANSDENGGKWNKDNNPAGLIFGSQFSSTIAP